MTVSSMVAHWLTDQLTGNVVQVTKPDTVEEFVALPHADGAGVVGYKPQLNKIGAVSPTNPQAPIYDQDWGCQSDQSPSSYL